MKTIKILILAAVLFPVPVLAVDLRLPPSQVNLIAVGMGNAVGADGSFFNATSFNPALLSRAPKSVEAFSLGLNVSDDVFGLYDYVSNLRFEADSVYQQLSDGFNTNNTTEINAGLTSVQDLVTHLTNKAVQAGAGANVAVRIPGGFGVQVYNSTHGLMELVRGNLTNSLLGISLPYDGSPASQAALQNAVTVLAGDLQVGINTVLTPSQQNSVQTDINNLKNGTIDMDTFANNVSNTLGNVDRNAIKDALLTSLLNDMATLTALAYTDTVFMGTYAFDPMQETPLTVGFNLKIVNRHLTYAVISLQGNGFSSAIGDNFRKSTTRWGIDLGALYEFKQEHVDVALVFQDLLHEAATISVEPGDILYGLKTDAAPIVVRLGGSWHAVPGLRVNADIDDIFSSTSFYTGTHGAGRIKFGVGYSPIDFLQLRAGFGNEHLSAGLGVLAGFFGLDYTYGADDLSQRPNHYAQMRFVF